MADFQKSLKRILAYEGGNSDNPQDPGGRTSRGVTQRNYDRWVTKHGAIRGDVWTAPQNSIIAFYREEFWNRIDGDKLPEGVALCIFDAAVNSGLAQTAKWVQRSLPLRADGDFGPITLEAILKTKDNQALIKSICGRRLAMLRSLDTFKTFGKGWEARVRNVQAVSLAWSQEKPSIAEDAPVEPTLTQARIEAKTKPMDQSGPIATVTVGGIGTVIASIPSVLADATDKLSPLTATWPRIAEVCAVITIISVIVGLYVSLRNKQHSAIIDGTAQTPLGG